MLRADAAWRTAWARWYEAPSQTTLIAKSGNSTRNCLRTSIVLTRSALDYILSAIFAESIQLISSGSNAAGIERGLTFVGGLLRLFLGPLWFVRRFVLVRFEKKRGFSACSVVPQRSWTFSIIAMLPLHYCLRVALAPHRPKQNRSRPRNCRTRTPTREKYPEPEHWAAFTLMGESE